MTQYKDKVELQKKILAAEEFADNIKGIQIHRMNSMWYDDRPQDTEKHSVTDTEYMSGKIERTLHDGTKVVFDSAENITDNSSNSTNLKVFVKDITNGNITLVSSNEPGNAFYNHISPE